MDEQPLLSIIICSIDPRKAAATVRNIEETSGIPCEAIVVDNRERNWPIAKVYNYGASKAVAPNLFFVHEDVLFEKSGWGRDVVEKLDDPKCGVIGFVGIQLRVAAYSPWLQDARCVYGHFLSIHDGEKELFDNGKPQDSMFRSILVVDGMAMFVSRKVWEENPFDEEFLTGFHCYDIDFCLAIARSGYDNYVYFGGDLCHYSNGKMDLRWAEATVDITDGKWEAILPMAVDEARGANFEKICAQTDYLFLRTALQTPEIYPLWFVEKVMTRYVSRSFRNGRYLRHLLTVMKLYVKRKKGERKSS